MPGLKNQLESHSAHVFYSQGFKNLALVAMVSRLLQWRWRWEIGPAGRPGTPGSANSPCLPNSDSEFRHRSCRACGPPAPRPPRPPWLLTLTYRLGPPAESRTTVRACDFLWHVWGWFLSLHPTLLHFRNSFWSRKKRGYFYSIGKTTRSWIMIKVYCFGIIGEITFQQCIKTHFNKRCCYWPKCKCTFSWY